MFVWQTDHSHPNQKKKKHLSDWSVGWYVVHILWNYRMKFYTKITECKLEVCRTELSLSQHRIAFQLTMVAPTFLHHIRYYWPQRFIQHIQC